MSRIESLVEAILDHPEEETHLLVLADWLEERGDAQAQARAELLRLQAGANPGARAEFAKLQAQAQALLTAHPGLVQPLEPLLNRGRPRLTIFGVGPSLAVVLAAPLAEVRQGPLVPDSRWQGHLLQGMYPHPTLLRLRSRQGNAVEGEMEQNFSAMYGYPMEGRFFFRGVVLGRDRLVFVTYRTEGDGIFPGLYQLRLGHAGWLTGTWWVPGHRMTGQLRLRHRLDNTASHPGLSLYDE